MDQIALLLLLVLGVPLAAGIWLIARAISARNQIEELARRVDALQLELTRLKHSPAPTPKSTEERIAPFMPVTLPPRKQPEPASPPPAIIKKLNTEIVKALRSPEISARLSEEGAELIAGSPEAFDAYLKSETAKWGKVIKAAGIQAN